MEQEEILNILNLEYGNVYLHKSKLPEPYCEDIDSVRAIVLGCDPSNKSNDEFNKVFGLDVGLKYFRGINSNIKIVGLDKSKLYVDNVCKNYFKKETYKNKRCWIEVAERLWISYLKNELDEVLPREVPVLATSDIILKALCYEGIYNNSMNEEYYQKCLYIKENENKLRRRVIPFFRHYKYSLNNWNKYSNFVKELVR